MDSWRARARALKAEVHALWLAAQDPRTPWYAKVWAVVVLGYALSPIDLIPDFIPVLGLLDDLILIPLGIALLLRMIPAAVMADARERARQSALGDRPVSWVAAAVIVGVWVAVLVLVGGGALRALGAWR